MAKINLNKINFEEEVGGFQKFNKSKKKTERPDEVPVNKKKLKK